MDNQQRTPVRGADVTHGDDCVIRLRDVELRRRRRVILTQVNLSVHAGEHWILFGPNGIGKSSLVEMMSARGFPSEGEVDVLGHRLGAVDVFSLRPRIGLSSLELSRAFPPQDDPLDAVLGALTATTGRWRDTYDAEQRLRARTLMRRFGIAYLEGKRMGRLSQGELTRVLMCRALMADPRLLILDEPTTGLDLGGREIVLDTLADLASDDDRRTMIVVTHRLEEIPRGFDHIAIMARIEGSEPQAYSALAEGRDPAPGSIVYAGALDDGLTARRLSDVFGLPLVVTRRDGRWNAYVQRE